MWHKKPSIEQGRIYASEIDGVDRIAVAQPRQIEVGAVQAGLDRLPQEENWRRRAVVGPAAAILAQAPAKFRKDQHHDPVRFTRFFEIVEKGTKRVT